MPVCLSTATQQHPLQLHLMGEPTDLRKAAFSRGFDEICRHLAAKAAADNDDDDEEEEEGSRLAPQLTLTAKLSSRHDMPCFITQFYYISLSLCFMCVCMCGILSCH